MRPTTSFRDHNMTNVPITSAPKSMFVIVVIIAMVGAIATVDKKTNASRTPRWVRLALRNAPSRNGHLGLRDGVRLALRDGVHLVLRNGVHLVLRDGVHLVLRDGVHLVLRDGVRLGTRDAAICIKSPSQTGCVSGSEMEGVSRSETGSISWSETEFVSGSEIAGAKTSHLAQRDDRGHLGQRDGQKKRLLDQVVNNFCGNLGAGGE